MGSADEPRAGPEPEAVVDAIRRAVPTSRHAEMLFDMVHADLGEDALLTTMDGRTRLSLYRRSVQGLEGLVPWPLLRIGLRGRLSMVVPISGEAEVPARPGEPPSLRNLGPAEIVLEDGPESLTLTYGEDGRWCESSRSQTLDGFAGVIDALQGGAASPIDLLAAYVVGIDLGRHAPARVHYPVQLPGGIPIVWNVATWAIRDALFDGLLPDGDGWVIADGYAGTALVWGESREEALAAWQKEVERSQPERVKPPAPPPDAERPEGVEILDAGPDGFAFRGTIRGPTPDVEWPEPTPENTPYVVIRIAGIPSEPPGIGSWVRLLGRQGATVSVLRREDAAGFTLVGHKLAEAVDLDTIDARIDTVPVSLAPPLPAGIERPEYDCIRTTYNLIDPVTGEHLKASHSQTSWSWGTRGRDLDGDALRWRALRQRWLGAG